MSSNGLSKKSGFNSILKHVTSVDGQRIIILLVTIVLSTLILCSKYFSFQSVIDSKGRTKQEIIATRTIEVLDSQATESKRIEASDKIKPIYKPVGGDVDEVIKKNLQELIDSIAKIRFLVDKNPEKIKELSKYIKYTPLQDDDLRLIKRLVSDTTEYNWKNIQVNSKEILKKILKSGISQNDLASGKISLIRSYFTRSMPAFNQEAIILLIDNALNQPNLTIDIEATEVSKKNAQDAVEEVKVYYKKGQIIIDKGVKPSFVEEEALKKLGFTVNKIDWLVTFGVLCFVIISLYITWYYLSCYEKKYANSPRYLSLLSTMIIISLLILRFLPDLPKTFQYDIPIYIFPLAAVTLITTFFTNSRIAFLITFMIIFLASIVFHFQLDDVSVITFGSIIAVFKTSKSNFYRDLNLIQTGFAVGLAQVLIVLSNYLITNNIYYDVNINELLAKCLIALFSGFLTGAITIAAMPHLEAIFNLTTPHGLMELADQNQPLLRRLQFEAPGTYHHSLMVSTLAEAAAEAISASTILVRVGSFYHDIGKLKRPSFFIENQSYFGIENPHDKLNPRLSKMVLTAHAKDGLELARQYNLPAIIQDMIIEHHGDSVMLYFYRTALEMEGPEKVIKEQFRYMGPKPSTKESAIIMLADATESAVRSLKNPSIASIEEKINKIIEERLEDNQLSDTNLTLKDIRIIAATFVRVLRGMQHNRIEYQENIIEELSNKHSDAPKHKEEKKNSENN